MKRWSIVVVLIMCIGLLAGCGKNPDLTVLMMPAQSEGLPDGLAKEVETQLKEKLGEDTSLAVYSSPMYSIEKLIAELAVATNGIMVIPENEFVNFAGNEGCTPLEDTFDQTKYKRGYIEGTIYEKGSDGKNAEKKETHLYGLPLEDMQMFQQIGFKPKNLYAIIPSNAPNPELALKALKIMAEQ